MAIVGLPSFSGEIHSRRGSIAHLRQIFNRAVWRGGFGRSSRWRRGNKIALAAVADFDIAILIDTGVGLHDGQVAAIAHSAAVGADGFAGVLFKHGLADFADV